ncbi:MAG: acyltransferase [Magnetococcales bacterium]|nr:acyltransferase [Magnetococcales bacterium]
MGVLRLLLAISVFADHSGKSVVLDLLIRDYLSVKLFFIVSGFYMSMVLNEKYTQNHAYALFVQNRILRLYPVYLLCLIIKIFISYYAFTLNYASVYISSVPKLMHNFENFSFLAILYLILSNIFIVGSNLAEFITVPYVPRFTDVLILAQGWSLDVEFLFYLIVPFLARSNLRILFTILFTSQAIYILTNIQFNRPFSPGHFYNRYCFISELWLFILGMIAYRFYGSYRFFCTTKPDCLWIRIYKIIAIGGIVLFGVFCFKNYLYEGLNYYFLQLRKFYYIDDFIIIGLVTIIVPFLFHVTHQSKLDKQLGDLSYPLYLVHAPILFGLPAVFPFMPQWFVTFHSEISLIISLCLAVLFARYLESKIDVYRQLRVKNQSYAISETNPLLKAALYLLLVPVLLIMIIEILVVLPDMQRYINKIII